MFTIDPNITAIPLKGKNLFKALFSMNTHQIATPEMGLANARSYVFFSREGDKRLSAYIGIYLLNADRRFFYPYSGNPFSENEIGTVEDEARNFTEDLGAMLDELDCACMSDQEKDQWIEAQDVFSRTPAPETKTEEQPVAALELEALQAPPTQQTPPLPQATLAPQAAPAPATPPVPTEPQTIQPPAAPLQAPVMQSVAEPQETQVEQPVAEPQPAPVAQPVAEPQQTQVLPSREAASPVVASPDTSGVETPPVQVQELEHPQTRKASADSLAAAAEVRQKIIQKAVKAGVIKSPPQSPKQETTSPTGVVSRDREALARLLTSF